MWKVNFVAPRSEVKYYDLWWTCICEVWMGRRQYLPWARRTKCFMYSFSYYFNGSFKKWVWYFKLFLPLSKLNISAPTRFWKSLLNIDEGKESWREFLWNLIKCQKSPWGGKMGNHCCCYPSRPARKRYIILELTNLLRMEPVIFKCLYNHLFTRNLCKCSPLRWLFFPIILQCRCFLSVF